MKRHGGIRALAAAGAALVVAAAVACMAGAAHAASGEKIGTVDTAFQWIGRDHDIIVEAYDGPAVQGVTCPTVRVPVDGSFLCSDPNGTTYTVQIVQHGQAYTVHPN